MYIHLIVMYNTLLKMTLLGGEQNLSIILVQVHILLNVNIY